MTPAREEILSNQYEGFHAEFYDIMHTYTGDVEFYRHLSTNCESVLEIGSGTGRLLIPILKAKAEITGIEPHFEMINICKEKMRKENLTANIIHSTSQEFSLAEKFSLVFIGCNTFQHFLTTAEQQATLVNIKRHLSANGKLIIDLSLPNLEYMIQVNGKTQVVEYKNPKNNNVIKEYFTATYDFVNQVETDEIILREFAENICIRKSVANVKMTYFYPRELFLLLTSCGYEIYNVWGDYNKNVFNTKADSIIIESGVVT